MSVCPGAVLKVSRHQNDKVSRHQNNHTTTTTIAYHTQHAPHLHNPHPKLPPKRRRRNALPLLILGRQAARQNIRLGRPNPLGLGENLVPHKQHHEEDQAYVRHEEIRHVPRHERRETLRQADEHVEEQTVPRVPWLPRRAVRQRFARHALHLQRAHEADVRRSDAGPRDESRDGADVEEPLEDGRRAGGEVEEGEEAEERGEEDGVVGDAADRGAGEEFRGRAVARESDENTRAGVDVGVGRDDEGRGGGVGGVGHEALVGVGHQQADEEDGEDEEEEDTPEGLADRRRHVLARVLGLAGGDTYEFRALVRETCLYEYGPETDELGYGVRLWEEVRGKGAGIVPVFEAEVALLSGAGVDADAEDEEADDGDDLDHGEPELELAVEADGHHVTRNDEDPEDGDKYTDGERGIPVLDDQPRNVQLQRKRDRPREEINPAHCETDAGVHETRRIGREGASDGDVGG
ncbi:hypothetical protein V493_01757 [Pseudogymnoascus sp. VKM F-4281 (FW-2241)]|nr:hypothetical protein V493_01757 [Pseudogymnoascus sp. VKM F-4281 (FW-2241)]